MARRGSVENEYNQAGEVVSQVSDGGEGVGIQTQTFRYDARGELIASVLPGVNAGSAGTSESRQYDADGRLIADVYTYAPGTSIKVTNGDGTFHMGIGGWLATASTYYYNADGEVLATFNYARVNASQSYWNGIWNGIDNGRLNGVDQKVIPDAPPSLGDAANGAGYGVLGLQSRVSHWGPNGEAGYDHEGNVLRYSYSAVNTLGQWYTTQYSVDYLKKDGYLEQATRGTSDDPSVLATADTSLYDAFGRRIAIDTHSAGQTTDAVRVFAYDAEGEILERRDGAAGAQPTGGGGGSNGGTPIKSPKLLVAGKDQTRQNLDLPLSGDRSLPRSPRLDIAGSPQLVSQHGLGGRPTFRSDVDVRYYLREMQTSCVLHHCTIHAYAILPREVRLLVTGQDQGAVSRMMQSLGRRFAQYANARDASSGACWQGRYRSCPVGYDQHALMASGYVESGPVEAGLVSSAASYRWSSYARNALGIPDPVIGPQVAYLNLGRDGGERCARYRELLARGVDAEEILMHLRQGRPWGNEQFVRKVARLFGDRGAVRPRGRPRKPASKSGTASQFLLTLSPFLLTRLIEFAQTFGAVM